MPFEILHGALVLLRGGAGGERAEVPALARLRVYLARVQPILTVAQLANHRGAYLARALRVAAAFFADADRAAFGRDADAAPPRWPPLRIGE